MMFAGKIPTAGTVHSHTATCDRRTSFEFRMSPSPPPDLVPQYYYRLRRRYPFLLSFSGPSTENKIIFSLSPFIFSRPFFLQTTIVYKPAHHVL